MVQISTTCTLTEYNTTNHSETGFKSAVAQFTINHKAAENIHKRSQPINEENELKYNKCVS